jgi:hypothetical protein
VLRACLSDPVAVARLHYRIGRETGKDFRRPETVAMTFAGGWEKTDCEPQSILFIKYYL